MSFLEAGAVDDVAWQASKEGRLRVSFSVHSGLCGLPSPRFPRSFPSAAMATPGSRRRRRGLSTAGALPPRFFPLSKCAAGDATAFEVSEHSLLSYRPHIVC